MHPARAPLFVSHGAPDLAISAHPAGRFLDQHGTRQTPSAWIVISAHLHRATPSLVRRHDGRVMHDYRGFDPALRDCTHPAPDAPALTRQIESALATAGVDFETIDHRPMDHGAWVPLRRLDPTAKTPVAVLGVGDGDARAHLALGRALAPFLAQDVGLLASGAITHALPEIRDWRETPAPAPVWVTRFLDELSSALAANDAEALLDWTTLRDAQRNHPTPEHLMPLFVALGAAAPSAHARRLHRSFSRRVLAMDVWSWEVESGEAATSAEAGTAACACAARRT